MPEQRSLSRIEERLPEADDTVMVIQTSNTKRCRVFLMFQPYAYEETKEEHREHLKLMDLRPLELYAKATKCSFFSK
jgi:hypothetical protein